MPGIPVATIISPFVCTAIPVSPLSFVPGARNNGEPCLVQTAGCTHGNTLLVVPPTRAMRSNSIPVVVETDIPTPCVFPIPHPTAFIPLPEHWACRSGF